MKKLHLIFAATVLLSTPNAFSQVVVENATTVKLGSTNNVVNADYVGKYGQAQGAIMGSSTSKGTLIESGNGESAGIYMDGDKIVMWSPGDDNLVNFCDEDYMNSGYLYHEAVIAYIDSEGYYYQVSDSTSKENIQNISSSLNRILKLRGVEYYHKDKNGLETLNSDEEGKYGTTTKKTEKAKEKKSGFLAQEVESIIPEAVATNKAGKKFVNYQAMIPFLVEAIKEQQTQLNKQEQEIELMKKQIEQLLKSDKTK